MIPILIPAGPQIPAEPVAAPGVIVASAGADWDLILSELTGPDGATPDAVLPDAAMADPAAPVAVAVPVPADPLQQWLDRQSGLSMQTGGDPETTAVMRALAEGLPAMPDAPPVAGPADAVVVPDEAVPADAAPTDAAPTEVAPADAPTVAPADAPPVMPAGAVDPRASLPMGPAAMPVAPRMAATPDAPARPAPESRGVQGLPARQADAPLPTAGPRPDPMVPPTGSSQTAAPPLRAADATDAAPPLPDIASLAPAAEALADPRPTADGPMPATAARAATAAAPVWQPVQTDPRPVLQQVAEAVITTREDRTEIALSPEELGRVRLILSGPDRAQITIWAERPETLDLLRRNADLLNQQLADAGVGSGSLDFRQDDRGAEPGGPASALTEDDDTPLAVQTRIALTPTQLSDRRLDIRI